MINDIHTSFTTGLELVILANSKVSNTTVLLEEWNKSIQKFSHSHSQWVLLEFIISNIAEEIRLSNVTGQEDGTVTFIFRNLIR